MLMSEKLYHGDAGFSTFLRRKDCKNHEKAMDFLSGMQYDSNLNRRKEELMDQVNIALHLFAAIIMLILLIADTVDAEHPALIL